VTTSGADGITVVVAREVAPGREVEFHRWVDELLAGAATSPRSSPGLRRTLDVLRAV
jgi:uncharacterized protein